MTGVTMEQIAAEVTAKLATSAAGRAFATISGKVKNLQKELGHTAHIIQFRNLAIPRIFHTEFCIFAQ